MGGQKTILITQSNYIPWKGYFDNIAQSDVFVVYDDVQYTKRDWRNRNKIKTSKGLEWLSIPVKVKGRFHQQIDEAEVSNTKWPQQHLTKLRQNYKDASAYEEVIDWIAELYSQAAEYKRLTEINLLFLKEIMHFLDIECEIVMSSSMPQHDDSTTRLVQICRELGGTEYISGPSAKGYLREEDFNKAGINLRYVDYTGYPEYPQLNPPFEHGVSMLDVILNTGDQSASYLKYTE